MNIKQMNIKIRKTSNGNVTYIEYMNILSFNWVGFYTLHISHNQKEACLFQRARTNVTQFWEVREVGMWNSPYFL